MPTFRTIAVLTAAIVVATCSLATARPARFHANVSGSATGPGHHFYVGDGLNLVFVDTSRADTHYRVCWTRGAGRKCWSRTTGSKGHPSRIFTAAPSSVATYRVTWTVAGRAVASWSFYTDVGD